MVDASPSAIAAANDLTFAAIEETAGLAASYARSAAEAAWRGERRTLAVHLAELPPHDEDRGNPAFQNRSAPSRAAVGSEGRMTGLPRDIFDAIGIPLETSLRRLRPHAHRRCSS